MYNPKEKVLWFAAISRTAIILLQFIFNRVLPDHNAGVFISPLKETEERSACDYAVDYLFAGLTRWDAQYFLHVSKYGYTYENTLAFSPLYPIAVRYTSIILKSIFFALNEHSTTILAALLINFICFVKSAGVLYELSKIVLKDNSLAYKAAILYCVNPASIFFSAFYSESMFAFISFRVMLAFAKNNPYVYLPIGLSAVVRSNGLINIGFPVYLWIKSFLQHLLPRVSKSCKISSGEVITPYGCRTMIGSLIWLVNIVFLSIAPYVLLQLYNYSLFCIGNGITVPNNVLKYGLENGFLIAGTENPPWCESPIPIAYSYVQEKYWGVGFMQYYEFKQIPNFLLAFPVLYVMLVQSFRYLNENRIELYTLGSFTSKSNSKGPSEMFVFVIHGLFLTIFCIFYVHIQVSTRLLCSASPLLYWYCASSMSHKSDNKLKGKDQRDSELEKNLCSKWRVFLFTQDNYDRNNIIILSYFIGYVIAGCVMFPNFLPWT